MATTTPFTDIPGQLAILRGRGMSADTKLASQWLSSVGDYRLSGYWYTYRGHHADGTPTDQFLPNTSLADVTMLYEFDRKLRTLIHDAIEHVEIGVRSHV
ncbi:Abi family protein, partial [Brachybacterium tyrofermentans]